MKEQPKTYYFNIVKKFNASLLERFTDLLNDIPQDAPVEIHLESPGGNVDVLFSILRIINNSPDRFKIICSGTTNSSALYLVLMSNCKKVFLSSYDGGVFHKSQLMTNTNAIQDKSDKTNMLRIKNLKTFNSQIVSFIKKLQLPEDKIKRISSSEDVFLTNKEVIAACKYKEKNNIKFKV